MLSDRFGGRFAPRGVSLIEVVAALVILFVISAAVLPGVVRPIDRERVANAAHELIRITDAMQTMRSDNQDWPGSLQHLALQITTSDTNICGDTYNPGRVNNWDGPYIERIVPPSGLNIGIGVVRNAIVRDPPAATGPQGEQIAMMIVTIDGVAEEDALELNRLLDGAGGATDGAVRWTVSDPDAGLVTVDYLRRIRGC